MVSKFFKRFGVGGFILAVVVAVYIATTMLSILGLGYDQVEDVDPSRIFRGVSLAFPLGTDGSGRNVLFLLMNGIRAFLVPGLLAALITAFLGAVLGGIGGYFHGWIKSSIIGLLRLIDALPRVVMLILICSLAQPSMMLISTTVGVLFVPSLARTIQHRVEALAAEDYILAYRSHGFSTFHIISYHIIWMLCRPLIVRQCAYVFGYVLFVETALSYLEFGVLPGVEDVLSWGTMVADAKNSFGSWTATEGEPHIFGLFWLAPALAIVTVTAASIGFANDYSKEDEQ